VDLATALWILVPLAAIHALASRSRPLLAFQVLVDVALLALPLRLLAAGAHLGPGVAGAQAWGAPRTVAGSPEQVDLPVQFAVWWEEVRRLADAGEPPWISDRMGGGTPLYAHAQTGVPFPLHVPVWALGAARGTDVMAVWKLELAALGSFLLLRRYGVMAAAAAAGSLAYAFGVFMISWLVVPLSWVAAGAPWALRFLTGTLRGRRRDAAALALLLGSLAGWSVHAESAAFLLVAVAVAGTVLAWGRRRRLTRLVAPLALAGAVAGVGAVPALQAIADSAKLAQARGAPAYPTPGLSGALRARAAALLLTPWREGHPGDGTWHRPIPAAAVSVAIGAAPLALLAAARPRRRHGRLWLALTAVGAGAAVLLYQVPGLAHALAGVPVLGWMVWVRAAFLVPLALALAAALAADAWLRRPRHLRLAAAALAVQAAVVALVASAPEHAPRAHLWRSAWAPAAVAAAPLVAASGGWLLPVVVAAESCLQAGALVPASRSPAAAPPALAAVQAAVAEEPGRVLGLADALPANLAAAAGLADLRSHEPLRPRSLAALHGALGSDGHDLPGPVLRPWAGLAGAWGVRWLVGPAAGPTLAGSLASGWVEVGGDRQARLYRNARALPVTRLASRAVTPPGDPREGAWEDLDFATTAVLAAPPRLGGSGTLDVVEARPWRVTARVRADGDVLVVHHAPRTAGWAASVDGRRAPLLAANIAAMAVEVGAGEHDVRFEYAPAGLAAGAMLTAAGVLGCAALARRRRRR